MALLGPSGSGKSTLLRILSGLDDPGSGRVLLDGRDVTATAAEKRNVAMVSQRPLLFPHLNVIDNVAFAGIVAGTRRQAARADAQEFLQMVRLDGFDDRSVRDLSGGQEQRVALARALAARPRVLLLDEPFSALDAELRHEMHSLLADVRAALDLTILLVTHDRDEAAVLADTVALIAAGRLVQHDTVQGLYRRPATLAVSRLMGGKNEIPGTVRDGVHHSSLGALTSRTSVPCPDGEATAVVRQESIEIVGVGEEGIAATVQRVRPVGARILVALETHGITLHAETTWLRPLAAGDRVCLRIPPDEVCVVR